MNERVVDRDLGDEDPSSVLEAIKQAGEKIRGKTMQVAKAVGPLGTGEEVIRTPVPEESA